MYYGLVLVLLVAVCNASPLAELQPSEAQLRGGRIYAGRNATIDEFPYQVALEHFTMFICGGAIISPRYVLTGAHCVPATKFLQKFLQVRAGATIVRKGGTLHNIAEAWIHEKHEINQHNNPIYDVALLKLKEPIEFDKYRQPIAMFEYGEEFEIGSMATVTGWGKTETGYPKQLQTVDVPMINTELCHYVFSKEFGGLGEGQICAGYMGIGKKDACNGDSGGPLVLENRLIGLVSYGEDCGSPDYPGVYTEIAHFRDWIDQRLEMSYDHETNSVLSED